MEMPNKTETEKSAIIKAGTPVSGPYVESARRYNEGEIRAAEGDEIEEEVGVGRMKRIVPRKIKPRYCR